MLGPNGQPIVGQTSVGDDERSAVFAPETPWSVGPHQLVIDRTLEDLVGNSVGRKFEIDVFEKVERQSTSGTATMPFTVE